MLCVKLFLVLTAFDCFLPATSIAVNYAVHDLRRDRGHALIGHHFLLSFGVMSFFRVFYKLNLIFWLFIKLYDLFS